MRYQLNLLRFVTLAVLLVAVAAPNSADARKRDRVLMQQAASDAVVVCLLLVTANKSLSKSVAGKGFSPSKTNTMGKIQFDSMYIKRYKSGLTKSTLAIARSDSGDCVARVSGNYESETFWTAFVSGLTQNGLKPTTKPIVARGIVLGSFKHKTRSYLISGKTGSAQTLTIFTRK